MRTLFYGTPEFAVPSLDALLRHHEVCAVVTQPDRPAHRGQRLTASPVKRRAEEAGLPVLQPPRVREPGWPERLRELEAELAVVVAFGQILPRAVLDAATRGSINVHASLLPRYRGAAPIAWSIIRGEAETGVTTMQMDEGMDTGPMLLTARTPISPEETAGELSTRLSLMGAELLLETIAGLDRITPRPQPHDQATLAPRLKKTDGHLDWSDSAQALVNRVRGCNPWPGGLTRAPGGALVIWRAAALPGPCSAPPGTVIASPAGLAIATGDGALLPREVQPENRRAMAWDDYLRGARLAPGAVFTAP